MTSIPSASSPSSQSDCGDDEPDTEPDPLSALHALLRCVAASSDDDPVDVDDERLEGES